MVSRSDSARLSRSQPGCPRRRLRVALSVARSKGCLLSASVTDRSICAAGAIDRSRDLSAQIDGYRVSPDPPRGPAIRPGSRTGNGDIKRSSANRSSSGSLCGDQPTPLRPRMGDPYPVPLARRLMAASWSEPGLRTTPPRHCQFSSTWVSGRRRRRSGTRGSDTHIPPSWEMGTARLSGHSLEPIPPSR
jgi:hypothetical protein